MQKMRTVHGSKLDQEMDKNPLELPPDLSKNISYAVWNWSTKMLRISSEAFF